MRKGITIGDILSILVPALVVAFLLNFVFLVSMVESPSMEPTLMTGDIVVYNRLAYRNGEVQRGDVIVFRDEDTKELIGKRVIGIQGDKISFKDGYVILNGEYVDETDFINEDIETNCINTFEVPEGYVFVLGDNREHSYDSRFWKKPYISVKEIQGSYMFSF